MSTSSPTFDPVATITDLNPATILSRLDQIRAEDAALRVLLRSVRAYERERARAAARKQSAREVR